VGLFKTADSLDAAMTELKANLPITDPNVLHGLVMQYHNTLIKEMLEQGKNHV